jgi:DNA polymerase gamma 1
LEGQKLWGKWALPSTVSASTSLHLPPLQGRGLDEHFRHLALEQFRSYFDMALELSRINQLPPKPSRFDVSRSGWTRYAPDGSSSATNYPADPVLVFDVEVLRLNNCQFPILAVAASQHAWYVWLSPVCFHPGTTPASKDFHHMIPLGPGQQKRLVVGHNVSYDRARILEEYAVDGTQTRFLDTMALHVAVGGMTSTQRAQWLSIHKRLMSDNETAFPSFDPDSDVLDWYELSALNSLQHVAKFYCDIELDKSDRDLFVNGTLQDVKDQLNNLVEYCSNDVAVTHQVYRRVFERFYFDKIHGHPVSFAGILEMGSAFLPVTADWPAYIERCESLLQEKRDHVQMYLRRLADQSLIMSEEERSKDVHLSQLDWTLMSKRKLPKWYRQLIPPRHTDPEITIRSRVTPLLLRMTWLGFPLFFMGKGGGWCFRVPRSQYSEKTHGDTLKETELQSVVKKQLERSKAGKASDSQYLQLFLETSYEFVYIRLPCNKSGSGTDLNCGSPFSKSFLPSFTSGVLGSVHTVAQAAIEANVLCSYWISIRERIKDQFIVWYDDWSRMMKEVYGDDFDGSENIPLNRGAIIPRLVTMGTITRRAVESTWLTASNAKMNRIGSELKSQIRAPPGYLFVGADVDSQELWIASLLGDAQFGEHGSTAFGWMTLQGSKSDGTDLHSKSAAILGASRDHAKIFNYARIYGSGLKFSAALLSKCNPVISSQEAQLRAEDLYKKTKGSRWYPPRALDFRTLIPAAKAIYPRLLRSFWYGGTESFMFNALEEIAMEEEPRTPVLGCALPDSLMPVSARKRYQTSCVNWVVQSSGVDYLHLLLVSMRYFIQHYKINARLLITIHDEIRYMVKEEDAYRAAMALQIANVWTRAYFAERLGMTNLPKVQRRTFLYIALLL